MSTTRRRRSVMVAYSSRPGLEVIDVIDPERPPRILMVVANPGISKTVGWPVGFWASELFHPFYEFMQKFGTASELSHEDSSVSEEAGASAPASAVRPLRRRRPVRPAPLIL